MSLNQLLVKHKQHLDKEALVIIQSADKTLQRYKEILNNKQEKEYDKNHQDIVQNAIETIGNNFEETLSFILNIKCEEIGENSEKAIIEGKVKSEIGSFQLKCKSQIYQMNVYGTPPEELMQKIENMNNVLESVAEEINKK